MDASKLGVTFRLRAFVMIVLLGTVMWVYVWVLRALIYPSVLIGHRNFDYFFTMSWVLGAFVDSWERLYLVV